MTEDKKQTDESNKTEETVTKTEIASQTEEKNKETVETEEKSESNKQAEAEVDDAKKIPDLRPGMTVRVYQKINELNIKGEEKERIQYFEGIIIAMKHGKEIGASITVRKISEGIGVEKIFPLNLPTIDKIIIKKTAKVKRAKLYFLKRNYKKKLKEKVVIKNK